MWRRYVFCPDFMKQSIINVKADMDEFDLTSAEANAEYKEIGSMQFSVCGKEKIRRKILSLRTLEIKSDVRRLFDYREIFRGYDKCDILMLRAEVSFLVPGQAHSENIGR